MVFNDVISLFTNMPLEKTIHLTILLLFEAKPDLKISRRDLQKRLVENFLSLLQVKPNLSFMGAL